MSESKLVLKSSENIDPKIKSLVNLFLHVKTDAFPAAALQLPMLAMWRCSNIANSFADFCKMSGCSYPIEVVDIDTLNRNIDTSGHTHSPTRDLFDFWHTFVKVGPYYIDFTVRQLGLKHDFPLVLHETRITDFTPQMPRKNDRFRHMSWLAVMYTTNEVVAELEKLVAESQKPADPKTGLVANGYETWHVNPLPEDYSIVNPVVVDAVPMELVTTSSRAGWDRIGSEFSRAKAQFLGKSLP